MLQSRDCSHAYLGKFLISCLLWNPHQTWNLLHYSEVKIRVSYEILIILWRYQIQTISSLLALCERIHRSPVDSPHKGQWRGALMFSLICAWTNGWAKNRDAGDLRRHRTHYGAIVIIFKWILHNWYIYIYMLELHVSVSTQKIWTRWEISEIRYILLSCYQLLHVTVWVFQINKPGLVVPQIAKPTPPKTYSPTSLTLCEGNLLLW